MKYLYTEKLAVLLFRRTAGSPGLDAYISSYTEHDKVIHQTPDSLAPPLTRGAATDGLNCLSERKKTFHRIAK